MNDLEIIDKYLTTTFTTNHPAIYQYIKYKNKSQVIEKKFIDSTSKIFCSCINESTIKIAVNNYLLKIKSMYDNKQFKIQSIY